MTRLRFHRFPTAFGEFTLVWGEPHTVNRIYLPGRDTTMAKDYPGAKQEADPNIMQLAESISRFLAGKDVHFSLDAVALETCSEFQRRVLLAEYGIPRGQVSTYQRIAEHIRCPGGARAVGGALASNPFPIIIPCHRAVRSDGGLGSYQGGLEMKRRLLEMEGVGFSGGRVTMSRVYY